jgi:hypothetical protein
LDEADELLTRRKEEGDWAEQKALAFHVAHRRTAYPEEREDIPGLAALLREVAAGVACRPGSGTSCPKCRAAVLAEVRRVVEGMLAPIPLIRDELLSRLKKL